MTIDYMLDEERKNNFDVNRKPVTKSVIQIIERLLQEQQYIQYNETPKKY